MESYVRIVLLPKNKEAIENMVRTWCNR